MTINTDYLERCIETLEKSYRMINSVEEGAIVIRVYGCLLNWLKPNADKPSPSARWSLELKRVLSSAIQP